MPERDTAVVSLLSGDGLRFGDDIDGDSGFEAGSDLDWDGISTERANGFGQFDGAAINVDPFGISQGIGDILAGDGAIETALAANPGLEGQRHLTQALGLLAIEFVLFLFTALLGGDALITVGE